MGTSPSPFKLLFVCMGNICRSPAAECVMRQLVEAAELGDVIECDSAGTISMHTGNTPDDRMHAAGVGRGIAIEGAARQIKPRDLKAFDLILVMDQENYLDVSSLQGAEQAGDRIRMFCEYCTEHEDSEVPDPYYGGDDGFEYVLDLLQDGCGKLLAEVREKIGK